ncbi:hypothetical protein GQ600_25219 [Phytophthora cactorum]|nr:hypothetical protein GQ600_25219 [Phytophthora cactorum]
MQKVYKSMKDSYKPVFKNLATVEKLDPKQAAANWGIWDKLKTKTMDQLASDPLYLFWMKYKNLEQGMEQGMNDQSMSSRYLCTGIPFRTSGNAIIFFKLLRVRLAGCLSVTVSFLPVKNDFVAEVEERPFSYLVGYHWEYQSHVNSLHGLLKWYSLCVRGRVT